MFNITSGVNIGTGITITYEYPSAPINTVLPVISGTVQVRVTVNCDNGTWLPGIPGPITGYAFQWQLGTTNIVGATSNSYLILTSEVGQTLRCQVTATNSTGSTAVFTLNTPAIIPNVPGAPTSVFASALPLGTAVITFVPPIDNGGAAIINYTATSNTGGYYGSSTSSPINITDIPLGQTFFFNVIASNSVGSGAPGVSNTITFGVTLTLNNTITGVLNNEIVRSNPAGTNIYTVSQTAGIRIYSRNTTTGALTFSSTRSGAFTDMIFSADGNYIFTMINGVRVYNASSFVSPIATATGSIGIERIAATPDNKFIFSLGFRVPSSGIGFEQLINTWQFNSSTNTLSGATITVFFTSGTSPVYNLFTSADGKNLYILVYGVTGGPSGIYKYDIDPTTGVLSNKVGYANPGASPSGIISYDNKNIYIGGVGGNVWTYSRNTSTGNLTFVNSVNVGSTNSTIAVSMPTSDNVLFTQSGSFNRDTITGNLTFITGSSTYFNSVWSVISPDDLNLYTVDTPNSYSLLTYTIS